jgi:GWxTD domain-containing protein
VGDGLPHFTGDYACFSLDDTLTYTELYFQIPFQNLHFVRKNGVYVAEYDVELTIFDASGNVVHSVCATDQAQAASFDETVLPANARAILLAAYLRPGAYRFRASVADRESGKHAEARSTLRVKDFGGNSLRVSDLQFSSNIEINPAKTDFVKNNRRIVPNVRRLYGEINSDLFLYYEIYNLAYEAATDSFHTVITIEREDGQLISRISRRLRKPGTSCVQSLHLPLADLPSQRILTGRSSREDENNIAPYGTLYNLKIEVTDPKTGQRAESSGRFSVWHSQFVFSDYSIDELVEQLSCIAGAEELKAMRRVELSQRRAVIDEFWKSKDPTPGTPENELMDEYYRRVKFTELIFPVNGASGWQSSRGQVYIRFGPPDSIRQVENRYPTPCYQIWEYAGLKRRFVFAEVGQGAYQLLDPLSFNGTFIKR